MIDERPMALNWLQFGIDCQIGLVGLAAAIPHLTRLHFTALLSSIWHQPVELFSHRVARGYLIPFA
jgi:hypothetical protein